MSKKYNINRVENELENKKIIKSSDLDSAFNLIYDFLYSLDISVETISNIIIKGASNNKDVNTDNYNYVQSLENDYYKLTKDIKFDRDTKLSNIKDVPNNKVFYSCDKKLKYFTGNGVLTAKLQSGSLTYFAKDIKDIKIDNKNIDVQIPDGSIIINAFSLGLQKSLIDNVINNSNLKPVETTYVFDNDCIDWETIEAIDPVASDFINNMYDTTLFMDNVKGYEGLEFYVDGLHLFNKYVKIENGHLNKPIHPININTNTPIEKITSYGSLNGHKFDIKDVDVALLFRHLENANKNIQGFAVYNSTIVKSDYLFANHSIGKEQLTPKLRKQLDFED